MNLADSSLPRAEELLPVKPMVARPFAQSPMLRIVGRITVVIGLILLALVTLPYFSVTRATTWPWWSSARLVLALPVIWMSAWWLTRLPESKVETSAGGQNIWIGLGTGFLGTNLLAALLSTHALESLAAAWGMFAFAMLAWALTKWLGSAALNFRRLAWTAAAAGAVMAVTSLVLWSYHGAIPAIRRVIDLNATIGYQAFSLHPHGFRNDQPFGHSNYTAGLAVLALPWVIWATVAARRGWVRALWSVGTIATITMLLTSGSRGGLVGLAGGVVWAVILVARAGRWSRLQYALALGGACVAMVLLAVAVPRVRNSVVSLVRGDAVNVGDRQRLAMMQVGLAMGQERWWIGQGPGLTPRLYPNYRSQVEGGTPTILQLHSTPLQIWADTGLPGLLFAGGLVAWGLAASFRSVRAREAEEGAKRLIAGTAGVSLAAYAAFSLTDYQMDLSVTLAFLATNFAVLAAVPAGFLPRMVAERASTRRRLLAGWGCIVMLGAGMLVTVPEWRARQAFAESVQAFERDGAIEPFHAGIDRAAAFLPDNPHWYAGAAVAHLNLAFFRSEGEERAQHLSFAIHYLDAAVRIDPNLEYPHFNLGWLLLERQPKEAAAHFRAWLHLLPDRSGGYLGLGLALLQIGEVDGARTALALEIVNDPVFLTSPAWDVPTLAAHRDAAARRAYELVGDFKEHASADEAPMLGYVHRLLGWWLGELSASESVEEFARASGKPMVDIIEKPRPDTPGWRVLASAMEKPADRGRMLARYLFVRRAAPATKVEVAELERMIDRLGTDWRAWLQAPEGRDAPFVRTYRPKRPAYAVVARNLDLPVPWDACIIQENELASLFFDQIFPERGWVSDQRLLGVLDRIVP